jgi:hypothetical protein
VRKVQEIVEYQLVVGFYAQLPGQTCPFFVIADEVERRNSVRVRQAGVAHPDPAGAVALDQRIGLHARTARNGRTVRVVGALPVSVELQPVVRALDVVTDHFAPRRRAKRCGQSLRGPPPRPALFSGTARLPLR